MSLKSGTLPATRPFEKKPKNHGARYSHVGSITDSGASASKVAKADSDRLIAKRRDELFKRVQASNLDKYLRENNVTGGESVYAFAQPSSYSGSAESGLVTSVIEGDCEVLSSFIYDLE